MRVTYGCMFIISLRNAYSVSKCACAHHIQVVYYIRMCLCSAQWCGDLAVIHTYVCAHWIHFATSFAYICWYSNSAYSPPKSHNSACCQKAFHFVLLRYVIFGMLDACLKDSRKWPPEPFECLECLTFICELFSWIVSHLRHKLCVFRSGHRTLLALRSFLWKPFCRRSLLLHGFYVWM